MSKIKIPFSTQLKGKSSNISSDFPPSARRGLLHIVYDLAEKEYISDWGVIARELQRLAREKPIEYDPNYSNSMDQAKVDLEDILDAIPWERAYDFCERLHNHLAADVGYVDQYGNYEITTPRSQIQDYIEQEISILFLEEGLAYDFTQGTVRRKGRRHTADMAIRSQVVLGDPSLNSARIHYEKAISFFKDAKKPDFQNTVKEAVCSVEAAAKALFPQSKATTLGEFVAWLSKNPNIGVPKTIANSISALYAFRSGGDGVTHGGSNGGEVTDEIAEYILSVCASQIIYLVDVANKAESDIPF